MKTGILLLSSLIFASAAWAAPKMPIPVAKVDVPVAATAGKQTAVFAGGCFWGTQAVFERVKGVLHTTVGYAGGSAATATYDQVITETTGHAESVEIVTEVTPLKAFYPGEAYHQDYALKNPENPYIQICDLPKIKALKEQFPNLFVDYKGKS